MALRLGLAQNSHLEGKAAEERIHLCHDAWYRYGVPLQSAICALANIRGPSCKDGCRQWNFMLSSVTI